MKRAYIINFFILFALSAFTYAAKPKVFMLIPRIKVDKLTLKETLQEIKLISRDIDPSGKGVNIILDNQDDKSLQRKISLDLNNIPVKDAIKYVLTGTNFKISYRDGGNTVLLSSKISKVLVSRFYNVSSSFPSYVDPKNIKAASNPEKVKVFISSLGIDFPKGSGISYIPSKNLLAMNNTSGNQEKLINALILLGCFRLPKSLINK